MIKGILDALSKKQPRLVDLTLPLRKGTRGVDWESRYTLDRDGWNARTSARLNAA